MKDEHRSLCPINLSLELFGDRWSLLIIRDMMFGGKRPFRELLRSEERISSNILADRSAARLPKPQPAGLGAAILDWLRGDR